MIYLDIGCHNGDSIMDFLEGEFLPEAFWIDPRECRIIGIDPIKKYREAWQTISENYQVEFLNIAMSNKNGVADFSEREIDIGSTICEDKVKMPEANIYGVEVKDIAEFVNSLDDVIVMRLDVEGEEYNILEKLIDTGTIQKIKYLEVEWHSKKMNEDIKHSYKDRERTIQYNLNKLGINWKTLID